MQLKGILTVLLLILSANLYAQKSTEPNSFSLQITPTVLKQIKDAENFATLLYSAVLTQEQIGGSLNNDYQLVLGELFFTRPLFGAFRNDYERSKKTQKTACIDHRAFLNSQEIMQNFWIGKIQLTKTHALVPVYLGVRNESLNKSLGVMLHLVLTADGWKIEDLSDLDLRNSLFEQLENCLKH